MQKRIGFIGLGLMGEPMTKNLLKHKFQVTVYNRTSSKTEPLVKLGAKTAKTPAEVAKNSDVVILMITAAKDVEEVLFGTTGIVSGAQKDLVVIDMGTIGPTAARNFAKKLAAKNIHYLDAPVTGSVPKAISGELSIFVGGDLEIFKNNADVFAAMGTNIQYLGPSGSGQAIKMINNYLIAASITALAEGMLMADALGLSRQRAAEVLQTVPAMSGMMNLKIPNYVKDEYPLLFTTANMHKDVSLAQSETEKTLDLPLLNHIQKVMASAMKDYSDKDFSIIINLLKKK